MVGTLDPEQAFRDYASMIYRYARFKLHDAEAADDVVGETFMRLLKKDNKSVKNPKLWLIGIARNVIYERYKQMNNIQSDINDQELENASDLNETEDAEIKLSVEQSLGHLESQTREIILLKVWEELKFDQIARVIDLNINTVKAKYYRGIEQLRQQGLSGKKLHSFSVPALVSILLQIKNDEIYQIPSQLLTRVRAEIGENLPLFFIQNPMKINFNWKQWPKRTQLIAAGVLLAISLCIVVGILVVAILTNSKDPLGEGDAVITTSEETKVSVTVSSSQPVYRNVLINYYDTTGPTDVMVNEKGELVSLPAGDIQGVKWYKQGVLQYYRCANGETVCGVYTYELKTGKEDLVGNITVVANNDEQGVTSYISPNGEIYTYAYNWLSAPRYVASKWVNGQEQVIKTWESGEAREPTDDDISDVFFSESGKYMAIVDTVGIKYASDYASGEVLTVYDRSGNQVYMLTSKEIQGGFNFGFIGFEGDSSLLFKTNYSVGNPPNMTLGMKVNRLDLETFNTTLVFDAERLSGLTLSPDGTKLVGYMVSTQFDQNGEAMVSIYTRVIDSQTGNAIVTIPNMVEPHWLDNVTLVAERVEAIIGPAEYGARTEKAISVIDIRDLASPVSSDIWLLPGDATSKYFFSQMEPAE